LAVLPVGDGEGSTVPAIEAETGLRRGRLEALLKTLRVDGAVDRIGSRWVGTGRPWHYDAGKYDRIVAARRAEAGLMRQYASGHRCLMEVLTEALDDPAAGRCGRCSVCTGDLPHPGAAPRPERVAAAHRHLRARRHVLEPRKLWPTGSSRRGRIAGVEPGRAVAFADDPAWPDLVAELAAPDAPPTDGLRQALVDVLVQWSKEWDERPTAVVAVPSRSHPRRVLGMAEHLAAVGRLPLLDRLKATGPAPPDDAASTARVRHLLDTLSCTPGPPWPPGPVLLVDDVSRTGWTLTVAAALLTDAGAGPTLPLVGHRRP
jgi:ATP-dependent DNA helicase RecQ